MKIIPSSRKRHDLARVSIFLTIIALTSATAGCASGWPEGYYGLEVTSTYGGSVTTPGEELFAYAPDTTVELVAEPDDHHHFWWG